MTDLSSMKIKKLIVHILDSNANIPVLSDYEHHEDDEINEYIENHITKVLDDDNIKCVRFLDDSIIKNICIDLYNMPDEFNPLTLKAANSLYSIMQSNPDIPAGDLCCALLDIDGVMHLSLLKLNYKTSYIHHVENCDNGKVNSIIKQKTTLPGDGQKVDECAVINLNDLTVKLIEKKYDINGEKKYYFSEMFLKCTCDMSDKEKMRLFKKATKSFNKKYLDEDITKTADIKKAVVESIERNDAINVSEVAGSVFKRNPELRDTYIQCIEKAGLKSGTIQIKPGLSEKVFKRHKIKTDTGIEIDLPLECYQNSNNIEFVNNPDGTISIIIKNISSITDI